MGLGEAFAAVVLPASHRRVLFDASNLLVDQCFDDVNALATLGQAFADCALAEHLPGGTRGAVQPYVQPDDSAPPPEDGTASPVAP